MAAAEPSLPNQRKLPQTLIPSSSPAFGTPVHPVLPRKDPPIPAPSALKPTILPILLPPPTLRPVAVRIFTRNHNLNLKSSALASLAAFIGRHCGAGWREEGLAERVLEEVARTWKRLGGPVIVDGEGEMMKNILKSLESCMIGGRIVQSKAPTPSLSREGSFKLGPQGAQSSNGMFIRPSLPDSHGSFGMSNLEVADPEEEQDATKDPREWVQVIGAFDQPRLIYNVGKKHFERSFTKPSLFPPPSHKTDLFRQRYHIVHQRVLRNEAFQQRSFPAATDRSSSGQMNKITPIANLLGRSGTTHLLLGLLTISPTGTLTLSDLTGSIALDLQHARPIPENGTWFTPGMMVLIDGSYEEDYSNPTAGSSVALGNTGGIGGTIGGKFIAFSVGHPPVERRNISLGIVENSNHPDTLTGPAFGWMDFLGVGSERATGARMRRLCQRLLSPPIDALQVSPPSKRSGVIAIASELNLSQPNTLSALKTLLSTYAELPTASYPLAIILMGNFATHAALSGATGAGSIEYKESYDSLASVLAEFPELIARTTLVFIPGDNDAWPSAFSAGAATPLPRKGVPDIFTNRIRRAIAEANREVHGRSTVRKGGKEGEAIWTTNPARLSWFGVAGEMVLFRDDTLGRLRRTAVKFDKPENDINEQNGTEKEAIDGVEAVSQRNQLQDTRSISEAGPIPSSPLSADTQPMELDSNDLGSKSSEIDSHTLTARSLAFTILSQSHLSPFPISIRPQHWSYASSLSLYPLPSVLILADSEAPPYALSYSGCAVLNPATIVRREGRRERGARWVEWDIGNGSGKVREEG